jgi:anti-anti-sigma factor
VAEELLAVHIEETAEAVLLKLAGEIDLQSAAQLQNPLVAFDGRPLLVDMSGVTFMDSSGLHVLLALWEQHGRLRVVDPSEQVAALLRLVKLYDVLCDMSET